MMTVMPITMIKNHFLQSLFSSEMDTIFQEVCSHYEINFSTLLGYASRRSKRTEIKEYIKSLKVLDTKTLKLLGS